MTVTTNTNKGFSPEFMNYLFIIKKKKTSSDDFFAPHTMIHSGSHEAVQKSVWVCASGLRINKQTNKQMFSFPYQSRELRVK